MNYRRATTSDYEALHAVRMAVKENVLVNTDAVNAAIYQDMLENRGAGWVCENEKGIVVGFSIVDLVQKNIWALFVHPDFESKGIGRNLHELMLNWSFEQGIDQLSLSTDPGTRAEAFYLKTGWKKQALNFAGELEFEISKADWLKQNRSEV